MSLAPIILFVYNRPEHTREAVEALMKNEFARESNLIIFSDGAKNTHNLQKINAVREYIRSINGFKNVNIKEQTSNMGLADSIISGITEVIGEYGKVIVLEDDIVTSPNFLSFMNESLNYYEDNQNIFSISGYNFPLKIPELYRHQVYISARAASWGWATWKDRWEKADWNPQKSFNIYDKKLLRQTLDKAGKDLAPMLLKQVEGKISSWAVRWAFSMLRNSTYCLYPINSFTKNIGTDASGTNFDRKSKRYDVQIVKGSFNPEFTNDLKLVDEIESQIHSLTKPGLLSYLKYRLFNSY